MNASGSLKLMVLYFDLIWIMNKREGLQLIYWIQMMVGPVRIIFGWLKYKTLNFFLSLLTNVHWQTHVQLHILHSRGCILALLVLVFQWSWSASFLKAHVFCSCDEKIRVHFWISRVLNSSMWRSIGCLLWIWRVLNSLQRNHTSQLIVKLRGFTAQRTICLLWLCIHCRLDVSREWL